MDRGPASEIAMRTDVSVSLAHSLVSRYHRYGKETALLRLSINRPPLSTGKDPHAEDMVFQLNQA